MPLKEPDNRQSSGRSSGATPHLDVVNDETGVCMVASNPQVGLRPVSLARSLSRKGGCRMSHIDSPTADDVARAPWQQVIAGAKSPDCFDYCNAFYRDAAKAEEE